MDLSIKLSVPLTVALVGSFLGTINSNRQNEIAQANQKDAVVREYIKEMKGMLLDKAVADEAKKPGSGANGVARALTLTALTQLKGDGPERRSLVFQFLRESNFPILAGSDKQRGANLSAYDLSWANLSGADLIGADLIGANLSGAYLSGADLSVANLSVAYLSSAFLSSANLSRAELIRANLSGANLSGANLSRATLIGANLSGAYLFGADLSGANLSVAYLSRANFEKIKWDVKTQWPNRSLFEGATNVPDALKKQLGL
jgi:uncharacterized protein YjbI with pentapeptide repeats